ncbi:MAG: hypothetical protein ACKN81_14845, partial [Pirellulaceae bacterium]
MPRGSRREDSRCLPAEENQQEPIHHLAMVATGSFLPNGLYLHSGSHRCQAVESFERRPSRIIRHRQMVD